MAIRAAGSSRATSPEADCPPLPPDAPPGTLKIYEIYENEFNVEIEVHYFRHPDGTVSGVKVEPRS
jgi:hypothetical protein